MNISTELNVSVVFVCLFVVVVAFVTAAVVVVTAVAACISRYLTL
jgi:hypothetical protein